MFARPVDKPILNTVTMQENTKRAWKNTPVEVEKPGFFWVPVVILYVKPWSAVKEVNTFGPEDRVLINSSDINNNRDHDRNRIDCQ